jgi:hypothetical protein
MNLIKECARSLIGPNGLIAAAAVLALLLCAPGLLAGALPFILVAACLLPCLAPFALLWRSRRARKPPAEHTQG